MSSEKPSLPVLVLKQRRRVKDRLPCPDTGADDCLAKPFSFSELSAHSRALVRRSHLASESVLTAADLKLDRVQRQSNGVAAGSSSPAKSFPFSNTCY